MTRKPSSPCVGEIYPKVSVERDDITVALGKRVRYLPVHKDELSRTTICFARANCALLVTKFTVERIRVKRIWRGALYYWSHMYALTQERRKYISRVPLAVYISRNFP